MLKKILVTGGTGFLGSYLVEKLIKLKYKVLVVDNLQSKASIHYINPKSTFIKGNILSVNILKKIEKWKPQIIYHLGAQSAGETAYDDSKNDLELNGHGTYLVSQLAKKIKIKHFIFASSVAVYGSSSKLIKESSPIKPDSIYGVSKYAGEQYVNLVFKNTDIKTTIFRIFNTYGPGENPFFLKKGIVKIYSSYVWQNKPLIIKGSLKRIRNVSYVDDVINVLSETIKNKNLTKNEVINLTSGIKTTVKEIVKAILKANNKKQYKIIQKNSTPGDSFNFNASNKYLKTKFKTIKFRSLGSGLFLFFNWLNKIPRKGSVKNFHPLKIFKSQNNTKK